MKQIALAVSFCMLVLTTVAQKHDNTWMFGYYYSATSRVCGLDFYNGAPDTVGFTPPFTFSGSGTVCMSNTLGDLMFYTNGLYVGNYNNQFLLNSTDFNLDGPTSYSRYWQGTLSVPFPDHADQYYLFHMAGISYSVNGVSAFGPRRLFYSVIDMNANNGEGEMIEKAQIAYVDSILPCTMQATRHANGRDWWIVNHKAYSDKFVVSLLTPDGVVSNTIIQTGPSLTYFSISEGQSEFSPDGSKFAMAYNTFNSVYLFDFDRCSGIISFNDSVQIVPNDVDEWPVWGCSFSPNSRYLYANTNNDLYQFDTWNSSMSAGMKHIADFDGFIDFVQNYFFRHRLGPDGKIYIVPWGGSHYLHVINDPDQGDTLCNFVQHQLLLSEYAGSTLPDFPNYRLGSLPGSPCDTLTEVPDHQQVLSEIEIFPNPGNGYFNVNYLLSGDEIMELKIINLMGEVVYKKTLPQFSTRHSFDLSGLSDGVYELSIQNNKRRQSKKFVMIR